MKTPFFELSKSIAIKQLEKTSQFADIVSYSSKTNPDVTKILEENTNCMFSVHLINELVNIKDKSRILFIAQAWDEEQIQNLIEQGIRWFVVDNESDLEILENYLNKNQVKINLLLRLKLKEHSIRTEKYYVFGMPSEVIKEKVNELSNNEQIENLGIHFHRKTQNMSEWSLKYELENTFPEDFFEKISIINIGGGLPSEYANTNIKALNSIFTKIKEIKDWFNFNNIKLMIEPGRFISAPAVKLKTKIIGIHENTIIVDASVYNGALDALVVPVKLLVEDELDEEHRSEGKMYIIKGITPCSMDIFRYRVYLKEKKIGDVITFINAGAYNFSSDFCNLEKYPTEIKE